MFGDIFLSITSVYMAYSAYWLYQNSRKILLEFDFSSVIKDCEKVVVEHIRAITYYSVLFFINYVILGFKGAIFSHLLSLVILLLFVGLKYLSILGIVDNLHRYTVSADGKINLFSSILFYSMKNSLLFLIVIYIIALWSDMYGIASEIILALPMFLFSYKFTGNMLTKIGDIIADYGAKIKGDLKEDTGSSFYSTVDNIGDIVGDAFGTFVDYLIVAVFLMYACFKANPYIQIRDCLVVIIGKIIFFFLQTLFLSIVSSAKKTIKFMDILLVSNIIFWTLIDALRRSKALFGDFSGFASLAKDEMKSSLFMMSFVVLLIILSNFKFYDFVARQVTKYMSQLCVFGGPLVILISLLFAFFLDLVSYLIATVLGNQKALIGSIGIFQLFILISVYYIFKTDFGVIIDSSCGVYKRYISLNYSEQSEKSQNIEKALDELDEQGNIFKLESKLFLYFVTFWILKSNNNEITARFIDISIILIAVPSLIFLWRLYESAKESETIKALTSSLAKSSTIFFTALTFAYVTLFDVHGVFSKDIFFLSVKLLFLSKVITISGSFYDIVKKYNENRSSQEDAILKKEIIKNDLIGDFFKDVLGPTLFSIALYSALIVYTFLSEYNNIKVI